MRYADKTCRFRGFTLLELLVVVGVIAILVGIIVPAMNIARKKAMNASAVTELHSIRTGLQQYYADFNMYPPSAPGYNLAKNSGPEMLAEGLMGYMNFGLDGAGSPNANDPAFGFRVHPASMGGTANGKVYGPYVTPDPNTYVRQLVNSDEYFIDPWGPKTAPIPPNGSPNPRPGAALPHKILYFRSSRSLPGTSLATATTIFGTAGQAEALFTYTDCTPVSPADFTNVQLNSAVSSDNIPSERQSRYDFLRQLNPSLAPVNVNASNNQIALATQANTVNGPVLGATNFLLISAGPDGRPGVGPQNSSISPWTGYFDRDDIIMTNDN